MQSKDNETNQANKSLVWYYWQSMNRGMGLDTLIQFLHPDVTWHGFRPLRHLSGSDKVYSQFWKPLIHAIPDLIRRPYVFMGGEFEGNAWVCGTGEFIGSFIHDWLNIPANGKSVRFRFGEFCKIIDDKIAEIRIIVDLPDLIRQSGVHVVPPSFGRDIWIPGPSTGDGVIMNNVNVEDSRKTLALVEEMIFGGLNKYDGINQNSQELEKFWHPQMVWHGPVGIGSAYGLDEFKQNAQGPIVGAFPDRRGVGHQARIGEGFFAASTGWPSLVGTHVNNFMDWRATGKQIGWNIMDFWRRDGDLLVENWVMIDLIGAALESGVDLLGRLSEERS